MKVWQVACTLARALRLNEDLASAIALGHDIGHAPFGHIGEDILRQRLLHENGFEHNEEGLFVALYFEQINLTYQTLEGILKHTRFSYEPYMASGINRADPFHKIRIHGRPAKDYADIMGYMGPPGNDHKVTFITQPTYEAQVVDIADGIAYVVHDLEDCLSRGIVEAEELPVEWYREFGPDPKNGIDRLVKGVIDANLALLADDSLPESKPQLKHTQHLDNLVKRMKSWYEHEVYEYRLASERNEAERMLNKVFDFFSGKPMLVKEHMHPKLYDQILKCGFSDKARVGHCLAMMTDHEIVDVFRTYSL
jgi:dGTPase